MNSFGFAAHELRQLRALKTPAGIQKFLDDLPYNLSFTARSPEKVLHDRTASCLEGGIFAAAALRVLGFPALIFDLEAEQDTDHVVAIFKMRGHWGAVAKSNFTGCRYGDKVYLVHDADDPYYHIAEQYCPNHIPEHVALHPAWILRVRSLMVGEQLSRLEKKQGACYQPTIAVVRPTNSSSKNHA